MGNVLMLIYEVLAIYSGYRFMTGRIGWLEENGIVNKIVKFLVCYFVGNIIAAFYLVFLIIRFILTIVK